MNSDNPNDWKANIRTSVDIEYINIYLKISDSMTVIENKYCVVAIHSNKGHHTIVNY